MNLDKAIQERKSVKKFSDKKPDWRYIIEAVDAAMYAPMAGNNYSLRFVLVDDPEKIAKLSEAAQQSNFANVKYAVVVLTDSARTLNLFDERGQRYLRQQAGAAIENFLLKIQEHGLSSCWIGHFVDYLVKQVVGAPENFDVEAILPVGYEVKPELPKRKNADLNRFISFNDYSNKWMNGKKIINA